MLGIAWLLAGNTVSSEADSSAMVPIVRPVSETEGGQKAESTENSLSPVMKKALAYVAQRYRVSADALRPVFEAAQVVGQERRIDPLLIVAIIGIESGFKSDAKSAGGGHGLMQIIPRYHLNKIPDGLGVKGLMDPAVNVKVGTIILDDAISRAGNPVGGLQSYNGSKKKKLFANRVLAEKARMERPAL